MAFSRSVLPGVREKGALRKGGGGQLLVSGAFQGDQA